MNTIEKILSQKAISPTPQLQADPFWATKIAALAGEKKAAGQFSPTAQWS